VAQLRAELGTLEGELAQQVQGRKFEHGRAALGRAQRLRAVVRELSKAQSARRLRVWSEAYRADRGAAVSQLKGQEFVQSFLKTTTIPGDLHGKMNVKREAKKTQNDLERLLEEKLQKVSLSPPLSQSRQPTGTL
jgi:hypothetical protein